MFDLFKKISQAPTRPQKKGKPRGFDVNQIYEGPLELLETGGNQLKPPLEEKLRQAYFWVINQAIICPYYDIEYNDSPTPHYTFGEMKSRLTLPTDQSYCSFVLLPLINLIVQKRCLLIGGPGRGKTASAMLMGVLAGYPLREVKRAIQHGQPQMTLHDLLGNPLPKDLIDADSMDNIRISWRKWLGMRVKIIDEYNRIPTRTQSALLTLMSDNYAEILDHIYECPESAWYLTANDDSGGGTYQVIEALRDRIDVVVKALHFSPGFLEELIFRVENQIRPEEMVPEEIIFNEREITQARKEVLEIKIPINLRKRLEFFASQFEFMEQAGGQFEYKTKDTLKLSGMDYHQISDLDTGRDKIKDLGSQTQNGLSVRALLTLIEFVKGMAYFRGGGEVEFEDIRQILPFVLHDKLVPDLDSPYFDQSENEVFRVDRISWIRKLWDLSCEEFDRLNLDKNPLVAIEETFKKGLEGVTETQCKAALKEIEKAIKEQTTGRKFYGPQYDNLIKLKYFHQRYSNYLRWLKFK